MTRIPRIASLFAGAGGLDLGLINVGANVIWANDIDRDACDTYAANIGQHIICDDISNIDFRQIPEVDIVVGGFPCQGFSVANLLRSKDDVRNTLYRQLLRCIQTVRPRVFLAENVRGILNLDKGAALTEIIDGFKCAGYSTKFYIANAADYGVPQNRWRVFFIGIHMDLAGTFVPPSPTHASPEKLKPGSQLLPWVSIGDALSGLPEPDEAHLLMNHIGSKYKVSNRNFTGHRRTDPNRPSPTILARGNGKGGVCAIQHPGNHRRLTVRESAIIQSFPLDFEFHGGLMSMYRQVGNAVPVRLAEAFGQSLVALEAQL
ncbi:MAG: DNA cytosine methyltransferase [Ktedonobacteraceae bacterium]